MLFYAVCHKSLFSLSYSSTLFENIRFMVDRCLNCLVSVNKNGTIISFQCRIRCFYWIHAREYRFWVIEFAQILVHIYKHIIAFANCMHFSAVPWPWKWMISSVSLMSIIPRAEPISFSQHCSKEWKNAVSTFPSHLGRACCGCLPF